MNQDKMVMAVKRCSRFDDHTEKKKSWQEKNMRDGKKWKD